MNELYIKRIRRTPGDYDADAYPFCLPALRCWEELELKSPVTFFVGENGTGKSTLLEAVAVNYGFNPEGGSRNFSFATRDTHSGLYRYLSLIKGPYRARDGYFLRAESFYNVASNIDDLDRQPGLAPSLLDAYGGTSLHEQSHGESFFALLQNRFRGRGLYLLDEPEAALSPTRQMAMLRLMALLVEDGSQFLVATHSPILTAYPGAAIYELSENGMQLTAYRETQNFLLTRRFLQDPEKMAKSLTEQ